MTDWPAPPVRVLLRACLATGDRPRPSAFDALDLDVLRQPAVHRAGVLPLLLHAAVAAGVELPPATRTLLRTARVHEELRLEQIGVAAAEILAGTDAVVVGGLALAHTAYAHPALRHCHDLDLLVANDPGDAQHPSGLPVARHLSVFDHRTVGPGAVDTVPADVAGARARVLAPADALVRACGRGSAGPLWCLDAAMLVRAGVDWDRVAQRARDWRVGRIVRRRLAWLARELDVPVDDEARRRRLRV